jgi:ectoine hydroxylase-related dioxygenase (phytanoyl-CoA dioxygenase family)
MNTNKHNSLHLANNFQSKKEVKRFKNERLSLTQANKLFKSVASPRLVNYGEILIFNTSAIHGTEVNNSTDDRISFDFRVLPYGGNILKVEIKGSLLKRVLDFGVLASGTGAYLQRFNAEKNGEKWLVKNKELNVLQLPPSKNAT